MVIANLKNICRGRCLHRPVAVCPIYNPWKNAMTLGQRAHNVHPYGLYGKNACFNMFWAYFVYQFAIQSLFLFLGNTAQFPPNGLSTAPAAAARHLRCQNAR